MVIIINIDNARKDIYIVKNCNIRVVHRSLIFAVSSKIPGDMTEGLVVKIAWLVDVVFMLVEWQCVIDHDLERSSLGWQSNTDAAKFDYAQETFCPLLCESTNNNGFVLVELHENIPIA